MPEMLSTDVILEIFRVLVLLVLVGYLWHLGTKKNFVVTTGWRFIQFGFLLVLFGSFLDITDNFESLNPYVVVGDTETEAFLEKVVGYLGGFILLTIGLIRWGPTVEQLMGEIKERKKMENGLRESEQKFRDFADSGADRFWETDENYRYTFISNSTTNTQDLKATLGLTRWEMPGVDLNEELWRGFRADFDARRPFRDFRYVLTEKDGKKTHLRVSGKPFYDDNRKFKGYRGTTVDETTEVASKQKADDAHTKFMEAMENLSVGFALWDAGGRFVACNDYFKETQGVDADQLVKGIKFEDYIRLRAKLNSELKTTGDIEKWVAERIANQINPQGEHDVLIGEKWHRIQKQKLDDGSIVAYHTDITERKKVEEGFKTVFQSSPAGISISTVDTGTILDVNEVWLKTLGYRKNEVIGKTPFELNILVDPEVRSKASQRIDQAHHTTVESQFRTKNGEIRDIFISGDRIEFEGQDCYLFISQDMTMRKQAEEQLRLSESRLSNAQKLVKLGFYERNLKTGKLFWSDEAYHIYGMDPSVQPSRRGFMNLLYEDDRQKLKLLIDDAENLGQPYDVECRIIHPDGTTRFLHTIGGPVVDSAGEVEKIIGTVRDITEEKRRENQLRQALKMEAVGQLTSGISHDFNNILAELSINLSLISGQAEEDEYIRKKIDQAQQSIKSGARLTGQLLAFSREQNLTSKPTDISTLVTEMNDLLERTLGATITVEIHAPPDLWPAMIDRHQLENALLNLAINARDAMSDGGILTVDCRNERVGQDNNKRVDIVGPGDYILVTVADTGTGIPNEILNNVFDPFFTTKEVGHGTGLGLSMVDGFIRQSNGYLNIESDQGVGTTVSLYLPRSGQSANIIVEEKAEKVISETAGETILVIEDNNNLRKLAIEMLESLNYTVVDGGDGADASNLVTQYDGEIDLLLSDVILPHGNTGPKIARRLKEQNTDLKVLLMSGYADVENRNSDGSDILYPLIGKPFSMEDIASAIHDVLQTETEVP